MKVLGDILESTQVIAWAVEWRDEQGRLAFEGENLELSRKALERFLAEDEKGADAVAEKRLREVAIEGGRVSAAEGRDSRRRSVVRTIRDLVQKDVIALEDGRVRLVGRSDHDFEDLSDEGS